MRVISTKPIWVKSSPTSTAQNVCILQYGTVIDVSRTTDEWAKYSQGWIKLRDSVGNERLTKADDSTRIPATDGSDNYSNSYVESEDGKSIVTYDSNGNDRIFTFGTSINSMGVKKTTTKVTDDYGYTTGYTVNEVKPNGARTTYKYDQYGNSLSYVETNNLSSTSPGARSTEYFSNNTVVETYTEYDDSGNLYQVRVVKDINTNQTTTERTLISPANPNDPNSNSETTTGDFIDFVAGNGSGFSTGNGSRDDEDNSVWNLRANDTYGIFGIPYQYMPEVDRPMDNKLEALGRMYAERVIAKIPLLTMIPGEPKFLAGVASGQKEKDLSAILSSAGDDTQENNVAQLLGNRQGRYYDFEQKVPEYFHYVDPLCKAGAKYLGIEDYEIPISGGGSKSIGDIDWYGFHNETVNDNLAYKNAVNFYIHSDTQISDSFGNNTRKSQIADKINGLADMANEIQFLLGTTSAMGNKVSKKVNDAIGNNSSENVLNNQQNAQDLASDLLGSGSFIGAITNNLSTVMNGGKLIFPEIWSDSSYMKDYSVTIKLRTPDADRLSWYLNIFVPICHILPFVVPKAIGPNGYIAPFLLRAFYKGMFNCGMGIVTGCNISRGSEMMWTLNGLPTAVDISLTIKDLYDVLGLSRDSSGDYDILDNVALLDYMANMCGINLYEANMIQSLQHYLFMKKNAAKNRFKIDIVDRLDHWANQLQYNLFKGVIR